MPGSLRAFRLLLLIGLALRVVALPLHGTGDVHVWKTWSYAATNGILEMYGVGGHPPVRGIVEWGDVRTTVDYPPATLVGLAVVGHIYRAIDPSYADTRQLTAAIKLSILIMDVLACALIWRLAREIAGHEAARAAALFYWLNPAILLDGAFLGYLDVWMAVPILAALVAARAGAGTFAGAALAAALLVKLQAVFAAPLVALLLWRGARVPWRAAAAAAAGFTIMAAIGLLPFAMHGALPNLVQGVGALLRHDMLSGNAANAWWIVTWLLRAWYAVPDLGAWAAWTMPTRILGVRRFVELGYPNPRPIGVALLAAAALWGFYRAQLAARRGTLAPLLGAGAFAVQAYFILSVQVHENHLYLAIPLLAITAAIDARYRGVATAISLVMALNLALFYGLGGDIPPPARTTTVIDSTVLLSLAHLVVFGWHARVLARVTQAPAFMPRSSAV
jgi:hypothetical protein